MGMFVYKMNDGLWGEGIDLTLVWCWQLTVNISSKQKLRSAKGSILEGRTEPQSDNYFFVCLFNIFIMENFKEIQK